MSQTYSLSSLTPQIFPVVVFIILTYVVYRLIDALYPKNIVLSEENSRWVLLTGCDSGIGLTSVNKISRMQGVKVIAVCFSDEGSTKAKDAGAVKTIICDLTDEKAVSKLCKEVRKITEGTLWAIVHNAGIVKAGFIDFQPLANYRTTFEINFFAIVNLNQKVMDMIKKARGRIVLVTSVDGIVSLPGNAPYDASKFATEAYGDALRVEASFFGVNVSIINPSTMKTPLALGFFDTMKTTWKEMELEDPTGSWKNVWTKEWLDQFVEVNNKNLAGIAQDPMVVAEDIAHAITALRPKQRYLSGNLAKSLFYALWVMPETWSFALKRQICVAPAPIV